MRSLYVVCLADCGGSELLAYFLSQCKCFVLCFFVFFFVLFFCLEIKPTPFQASVATVQLWVSGILAVLRVLVSQSTEDIVLSRVHELSLSPHLLSCPTIKRLHQQSPFSSGPPTSDLLSNQEPNGEAQKVLPEETFAR